LSGRRRLAAAVLAGLLAPASTAVAGGYDTPMLYSARHIGMGGTAIGFVEDASAMFHNPAGLGNVKKFSAIGDFSLLLAHVTATPDPLAARDKESELTVAPVFLLGSALRLTDWLVAGLAIYPIASAGASYEYPLTSTISIENKTRLVFVEASPGLAVNLPHGLRLGAGYRITYVNLERYQGTPGGNGSLDFKLDGFNLLGFRVGAQWTARPGLSFGAVYRHKVETRVTNDTGVAYMPFTDVETRFMLPSKLGGGGRWDVGDFGLALDGEYLFNSQNEGSPLEGTSVPTTDNPTPMRTQVPNVFDWSNAVTVRAGIEFRFLEGLDDRKRLAARLGYVFDGKTANERYPSAFGTPPGPTHVLTAGMGWNLGGWQLNAAYGLRFGQGDVTPEDIAAGAASAERPCRFCSGAGSEPYKMRINGFYLDASFALD
jgi:long-subunit fatty acid transport protein